jgi:glycosyltransferase involved in cell wall biosynthesis
VLRRVDRNEYAMDFLVDGNCSEPHDAEALALGARIIPHAMPCRKHPLRSLTFTRTLRQVLHDYGPYDVLHSHHYKFSGFILRSAARVGVKVRIAHGHSSHPSGSSGIRLGLVQRCRYHLYSGWIDRYATAGLACSRESATALFGSGWQSDPRWRILNCGIDVTPFRETVDREAVRRELGIDRNAIVVGHVASFRPVKNHGFLLEVAAHCRKRNCRVIFLLLGEGPLRPEVQRTAERLGLEATVRFGGVRGDIPRLMCGALDMLVLPSLWEGLPMVTIEAQAAGVPVLMSDRVTEEAAVIPDMVQRASLEDGPEAWAERILAQVGKPRVSREEMAKAIAESPYNIDQSVAALNAFYCRAVQGL